jgi:magnesium transporter
MADDASEASPSEATLSELERLLEDGRLEQALAHLAALHPADQAQVIADLESEPRALLVPRIPHEAMAEILGYVDEEVRRQVVAELEPAAIGPILDQTDRDVAADVLRELAPERARAVLGAMRSAADVTPLLPHPDQTAGGRMTSDYVALQRQWTVEEAISYLRRTRPGAEQVFYLYVVDDERRLEGVVSLRQLVVANPEERIGDLMEPEVVSARTAEDQEEVARRVAHYNFVALPVVDEGRHLVGVVSVNDLMDVAEEEATEDMYRMAGVGVKEWAFSPLRESILRRVPWLSFNMLWAFAGAGVISLFKGTIEQVATVAVFMPMIAGQAGNAGIQTATIVVRSMALGEVGVGDARRLLLKEWALGATKGVIFGSALGVVAWLWTGNDVLGYIAGFALFCNMLVAATAGVLIPMALRRLGFDPATIAGVFDTMLTDLMGFVIYLGLATLFLSRLT